MNSNYSANNSPIIRTNINPQEAKPPNSQELARFIFNLEKQIKDEQAAELTTRETKQNQLNLSNKENLASSQINITNTKSNPANLRTPSSYD